MLELWDRWRSINTDPQPIALLKIRKLRHESFDKEKKDILLKKMSRFLCHE